MLSTFNLDHLKRKRCTSDSFMALGKSHKFDLLVTDIEIQVERDVKGE